MLLSSRHTSEACAEIFGRFSFLLLCRSTDCWLNGCCGRRRRNTCWISRRSSMRRLRIGLFRTCVEHPSLLIRSLLNRSPRAKRDAPLRFRTSLGWSIARVAFRGLDGVDGKLARLNVQTTEDRQRRALLDYFVEMSWWTALAYHFHATGQVRYAYVIWLIFFACDSLERLAKWSVEAASWPKYR